MLILTFVLPLLSYGQYTSKDNYTGLFTDNGSWTGGTAPDPSGINASTNIYGYITSNSDITIDKNITVTIYDTLIINGNLNISLDASFNIESGALCIVYGNVDAENKVELAFGSHFVVTGDFKATGNSTVAINPGAAVYILGSVDTNNMPELECNTATCKPEEYVPPGDNCCVRGDIISMEDNENNVDGIYDFFISLEVLKGIIPVYSELCEAGDQAAIEVQFTGGTNYQWLDSLGTTVVGTGTTLTTAVPGEYFATFDYYGTTYQTYPAKIVAPVLSANVAFTDVSCRGETDGTITISNSSGGSGIYEYTINGGIEWYSDGSFANLAVGTYNVQMRDAEGTCVKILNNSLQIQTLDSEAPVVECPANITTLVDGNQCFATITDLGYPVVSDNCTQLVDLAVSNDAPQDNQYSTGTTSVIWTVEDESGNSSTCQQTVEVETEPIDIEVTDLGNSCQSGETGSTTTLIWELNKLSGTVSWSYDYAINDGTADVASGTNINSTDSTVEITYEMNNQTATDKTFTLTVFNVNSDCGTTETNLSNNSDEVTMYGIPATSEIISN